MEAGAEPSGSFASMRTTLLPVWIIPAFLATVTAVCKLSPERIEERQAPHICHSMVAAQVETMDMQGRMLEEWISLLCVLWQPAQPQKEPGGFTCDHDIPDVGGSQLPQHRLRLLLQAVLHHQEAQELQPRLCLLSWSKDRNTHAVSHGQHREQDSPCDFCSMEKPCSLGNTTATSSTQEVLNKRQNYCSVSQAADLLYCYL